MPIDRLFQTAGLTPALMPRSAARSRLIRNFNVPSGNRLHFLSHMIQPLRLCSVRALIVTLLVGTAVSVFQAVTQVHETTLTFLPKLLAIGRLLAISAGWLVEEATTYAQGSFGRIATVNQ